LTEFEEFSLESVRRHEVSHSAFLRETASKEEEERRQAAACTKAHPLPMSTYQKTFELKPSERDPLLPVTMQLNSTLRAEERKVHDAEREARQAVEKMGKDAALAEKTRVEEEELQRLRRTPIEEGGMQFMAREVMHGTDTHTHTHSEKKLTVPVSPHMNAAMRSTIRPQAHYSSQGGEEQQQR
jgi:hypothetical protein